MDRKVDETARLLRERETRSLRLLIRIALGLMVVLTVYTTVYAVGQPSRIAELGLMLVYMAVSIANCIFLLLALRRPQWVGIIGIIIALCAASATLVTGFLMFNALGANVPVSVLAKLPLAVTGLATTAFMALTLRPLYVAIAGAGAVVSLLGFYALAALDPATTVVSGSAEAYLGPAISSSRLATEVMYVSAATICMTLAVHFARRTMGEAIALQRSTDQISRYFSPDIARGILGGGDEFLRPGGKEQDVVVLFSDLAGYTKLCAGLPAGEVLAMLSEYHEAMVAEIFKAGGTLDKFMGDGIMATFGTPVPTPDAADRAVQAALGMTAALVALNEDRARRSLPPLAQRIGIHAGPAIVGNVGTSQRLEYTVIGDVVNVANRIQAKGKSTGRAAMMSAAVVSRLMQPVASEALGPVALDGQPLPIELYALTR